jgi:hypothetical protein
MGGCSRLLVPERAWVLSAEPHLGSDVGQCAPHGPRFLLQEKIAAPAEPWAAVVLITVAQMAGFDLLCIGA